LKRGVQSLGFIMRKDQSLNSQAPFLSSVMIMRHKRIHWLDIQMTLQCIPLRVTKPAYVNSPLFDPHAENYMIERSFTDLESFHKALCQEYPHERLPEFPERTFRQIFIQAEDYFLMKQVSLYLHELHKYMSDYVRPGALLANFFGKRERDLKKEMPFSYLEDWNLVLKMKQAIKKHQKKNNAELEPPIVPQRSASANTRECQKRRRQSLLAFATTNDALQKQGIAVSKPKVHFEERWSIGGTTPTGTPRASEELMPASLSHLFPSKSITTPPPTPPKVPDSSFQKVKVHIEESHTVVIKAKSTLSWQDLKERIQVKLIRNGILDSNHPGCYFSCFKQDSRKESMMIIESEAQWQSILRRHEEWIHLYLVH
jgi:hypothetical protein